MAGSKKLVSQFQIEVKPLEEMDVAQLDAVLRQHVRDRFTGEILGEEIAGIEACMGGARDEYSRTRKYLRQYVHWPGKKEKSI